MRQIVGGTVEALGYELMEAANGREALDLLQDAYEQIQLILLDVNMPVMDGFQTLEAIQNDERFRQIPVVMVTTEGEKHNIVRAVKMGAANYVVKPFTSELLASRILDAMGLGF
ncbi:MAG: response regulator [Candidatus Hydrogenedentota bacterium]